MTDSGRYLGAGLDHHDGVTGTADDEVELRLVHLAGRGVDHELAIDATDPDGRDRAQERDLADAQGSRCRDGSEDVRIVLLVRREHREYTLDVVLVALGEKGADGAVRQAGRQDRRLRGASLTLDEASGDLARGVHPLLEVDGEREEVETRAGFGSIGRSQQHGVSVLHGHGATGEQSELARLDGEGTTTELGGQGGYRHLSSRGRPTDRARWGAAAQASPETCLAPAMWYRERASPAGAAAP